MILCGRIVDLEPGAPDAEAVALRDGRVVAVGSRRDCEAALPGVEIRDVGDAFVLPGLCDAHGHLLGLGQVRAQLDLRGTASEAELVSRVVEGAPPGDGWIAGFGWDQTRWDPPEFPRHDRLSSVFASRPVALSRVDGHSLFANAEGLRRAGIDRLTPDPAGGRIVRDSAGEPTGVLVDAAMDLLRRAIPPPTDGERERLVLDALRACAESGLTAVHDAGMDAATLAVVERLDTEGRLPLRVYAMVEGGDEAALSRWLARGPHQGDRLTVRAVKLYLDGALGSRGARFCEPYDDDPGNLGLELLPAGRLRELLTRIDGAGFQVAMHAIGDAANALALESLESCGIGRSSRPRIEHAQVMRLSDVPRLAKIGAIASMQPAHCTSDMAWLPSRIGARRLPGASAWRTLLEAGVPLAFGSDFPIEPPDPRKGLFAALTRQDEDGRPPGGFYPEERLGALEALRAYTSGGAFASFDEERAGRIAPGMRADLTVLGLDPRATPHRSILEAPVLATIVGGDFVVDRLR